MIDHSVRFNTLFNTNDEYRTTYYFTIFYQNIVNYILSKITDRNKNTRRYFVTRVYFVIPWISINVESTYAADRYRHSWRTTRSFDDGSEDSRECNGARTRYANNNYLYRSDMIRRNC